MRTMGSVGDGGTDQGQGLSPTIGNRVMSEGIENGVEKNLEGNVVGKEMESVGIVVSRGGDQEVVVGGGDEGDGGVREEVGEKLGEGVDGEIEDQTEEGDGEGEEEDVVADAGRPKLDEGFYEIEAVRRKRVRKGVIQYLIKWRDWPETANTWEPIENLQSCSDVIEAFEERLSSGKGTQRRRKRKSGVIHAQIRRKQPRSVVSYNQRSRRVRSAVNSPVTSTPIDDSFAENPSSSEYNISAVDHKQYSENDVAVNSEVQLSQDNDLNMKLTEFRGGISNDEIRADNLVAPFQVDNGSQSQEAVRVSNGSQLQEAARVSNGSQLQEAARVNNGSQPQEAARVNSGAQPQEAARVNNGSQTREAARVNNGLQPREAVRVNNGLQAQQAARVRNGPQPQQPARVNHGPQPREAVRVNNAATTPSNHHITGSKKRKSGKVRRFIPDPDSHNTPDDEFDPVPGLEEAPVHENLGLPSFPASNHKITEIIKPLSYAPPESNTVHDVVVTFLAMRSDGKEVLVDNKFMKAYYPLQLINFYEKNLRYNPVS
ncbi:unnamed protein product [Rhodiola kirilowii]